MKRGLVEPVPSHQELDLRVGALHARLHERGLVAALIYGDVSRSDDIAYLTNLCIYWNEGVLGVPADGAPVFLTKLSKRVHGWMRCTTTLDDLRSGPQLGRNIVGFVGEQGDGPVGIVDRDWWPARLLDEVTERLPGRELVALDGVVRDARRRPSAGELDRLRRAGAVLGGAVTEAAAAGGSSARQVALVELRTRRSGFLDVLADADHGSIDVRGQVGHVWVRAARTSDRDVEAALGRAVAAARAGVSPRELARAVPETALRCIDHADLATGGDLLLDRGDDTPLEEGAVVAIVAEKGQARACETVVVGRDAVVSLTAGRVDS
jgi:hypothetical protein